MKEKEKFFCLYSSVINHHSEIYVEQKCSILDAASVLNTFLNDNSSNNNNNNDNNNNNNNNNNSNNNNNNNNNKKTPEHKQKKFIINILQQYCSIINIKYHYA